MSRNSYIIFVVGIIVLSVTCSHSNPMPQGTLQIRSEINIHDCGDEENHPNINITSGYFFRNVNSTVDLLHSHTPHVNLTCYANYPVEWVFQELLSMDAHDTIQESREWISSGVQRYVINLTFKLTKTIHNVTCRAATDGRECRQTTIKFIKGETNGTNTTIASVHWGFPKGILLQQYYDAYEGNNINCSIHLLYNKEDGSFECYSQNKTDQLVLRDSDRSKPELCYDSFSCGLLYNKPKTEYCRKQLKDQKLGYDSGTALLHSPFDSETLAGIVTCQVSAESENNQNSISASSHFFLRLPNLCVGAQDRPKINTREIYVDLDPLSLREDQKSDFISFCGFGCEGDPLYVGDIVSVTCYTSVYLFAEAVQVTVNMKNGYERHVTNIILKNAENPSQIKRDGYREYRADINITSTDIYEIMCSAPLRKRKEWFPTACHVQVLPPIDLQIVGPYSETVRVRSGGNISLKCLARAEPKPHYVWRNSLTEIPLPTNWVEVDGTDGGSRLTIPFQNWWELPPTIVCVASNRLKFVRKTFTLQFSSKNVENLEDSADSHGNKWIGIVIPLAVIMVGGIIALLVWKIISQRRKLRLLSQAEIEEFMNGRPDVLNNSRSSSEYDVNSYAMSLPYNRDYEVLKEHLEIGVNAVIGSGAYGMVLKGVLTTKNMEKIQVAIKTLKPMDDILYFKALMSELKIMGFIGNHENIVNLLGAYTKNLQNREIYIVIEYCDNGCMLNYMRSHRGSFVNHVVDGTLQNNLTRASFSCQPQVMNTATLLRWCIQVANGMDFLYYKKVIHGDLAARNILLSRNLTAKIGDFGLSRQLFEYANYIKKQQSPLPWKWLAIECLQDMKFSYQSDVWAYGVTLWEVFSLGHSPFPGCAYNEEFIDSLVAGKRPVQPQYATKEMYNVMSKCWEINPSDRPSFAEITIFFDNTIRSVTPEDYMDLESNSDTNLLLPVKMEESEIVLNSSDEDSNGLPVDISRSPRNNNFRVSFMKNFRKFSVA